MLRKYWFFPLFFPVFLASCGTTAGQTVVRLADRGGEIVCDVAYPCEPCEACEHDHGPCTVEGGDPQ